MGTRGQMTRKDRQMPEAQARAFLRSHSVAHVGTIDTEGWPYVVPLMYVYEEGEVLYLHTGARGGHFHSNVTRTVSDVTMPASIVVGDDTTRNSFREGARICISVSEPGPMHTGTPSPCNSALVYQSAILFGKVHVCEGADIDERKTWFFDRLLQRLGDSRSNYAAGYTMLKQITLYEVAIEILTGKINAGLHH